MKYMMATAVVVCVGMALAYQLGRKQGYDAAIESIATTLKDDARIAAEVSRMTSGELIEATERIAEKARGAK